MANFLSAESQKQRAKRRLEQMQDAAALISGSQPFNSPRLERLGSALD
jgi:hypothetical protein